MLGKGTMIQDRHSAVALYYQIQQQLLEQIQSDYRGQLHLVEELNHCVERLPRPPYTYDLLAEYGPADFDRRHVFAGSYVYYLPFYKDQKGFAGHLLGGWELFGIGYLYSGLDYTAIASTFSQDRGGLGLNGATFSGVCPDLVGDPQQAAPHTIAEWFNKAAFAAVPSSEIRPGNEKRGTIVGPSTVRWDANLYKNTNLTERVSVQFRAEAFNVLNHTNLNGFGSLRLGSSAFGKITSARDPRIMQLALKLIF